MPASEPADENAPPQSDRSRRELGELFSRLYTEQQKVSRRSYGAISKELPQPVVKSTIHGYLHGTRVPPDARRFAEILGGTNTDLNRAEQLARQIQAGPRTKQHRKAVAWAVGGSDAVDHLEMRATGRRPGDGRGGDLFTGRTAVTDRIQQWVQATDAPGTVLVVTGQPGAGKSSVVARAVRTVQIDGEGLFFHARGGTRDDLLELVRQQTQDNSIDSAQGWIKHLDRQAADGKRPMITVADALDEAVSDAEITRISQVLTSIAAHPAARVVVATRRGYQDQLLRGLNVRPVDAANLVDLDTDEYFDPDDLQWVAARHLTQSGVAYPGPPAHAWVEYRANAALTDRLATVIARRADRSFLVAAFAAHSLSTSPEVLDPGAPGLNLRLIPSSVEEAFTKYFDTIPDGRQRFRTRRLLIALAFAYGPGLDDDTWLQFADALGLSASREDVQQLRRSPVADYLLETHPAKSGQPVRTRLYHQALVDQLREDAEPDDGHRVLRHLMPAGSDGWGAITDYTRLHLIDHAAATGELLPLLQQPEYLAVADLSRVLATLPARPTGDLQAIAAILRICVHRVTDLDQLQRTLLLAQAAAHLGLARWQRAFTRKATELGGPTLMWGQALSSSAHQIMAGHGHVVSSVAIGNLPGRDLIVTGSEDGTARIWNADGQSVGGPIVHDDWVSSVAIGSLGGRDLIVTGCYDGTARIWDIDGQPVGAPPINHGQAVFSVAMIESLDSRYLIVTGSYDGTARIWDLDGHPIGEPITGHTGPVSAVAVGRLGGREVIVTGSEDRTARIWDLDGHPVGDPITGHKDAVRAVAIGQPDGREVIATGSDDKTARIWDSNGHPVGDPIVHSDWVTAVAVGRLGGREVIVTGSDDRTARIWDLDGHPVGDPITGHEDVVTAMAIGHLGGREVIVTAARGDTSARIWFDGRHVGLFDHNHIITAVAIGSLDHRDVILTAGLDGAVRIWDSDGQPIGKVLDHGHVATAVAIGSLDYRDVIVTGGMDGIVRIWTADGRPLGDSLIGHEDVVSSLAIGSLDHRDVIITGSEDGTTRIWNLDGQPIGKPLGQRGTVDAARTARLEGRDVVITGGEDQTLRIWDQHSSEAFCIPSISSIGAAAISGSVVYVATGSAIIAWRFAEHEQDRGQDVANPSPRQS